MNKTRYLYLLLLVNCTRKQQEAIWPARDYSFGNTRCGPQELNWCCKKDKAYSCNESAERPTPRSATARLSRSTLDGGEIEDVFKMACNIRMFLRIAGIAITQYSQPSCRCLEK